MSSVRAMRAGAVLGSGVARRGAIMPCPSVTGAEDPAAAVVARLEAAGACLLALPNAGYSPHMKVTRYEVVQSAADAYGWDRARVRQPHPSGVEIDRMDEALGWLAAIPEEKFLLRRLLGARALRHPLTGRHLYPWRRLAGVLGADHKAVQRWHREGVALVLAALRAAEPKLAERRASR